MTHNIIVWALSITSITAAWTFAEAMRQRKPIRTQTRTIAVCLITLVLVFWLGSQSS